MRSFKCVESVLAAALLIIGVGAKAGTFTNGSFEIINHAAIPSGTSVPLYPGDTWLTGWTAGGPGNGDVAVQNGVGDSGTLNPYDGQQWIIFNTGDTAPGGILSQTITTTVGQSYTVSFAVGRAGSGAISLTATALAADSTGIGQQLLRAAHFRGVDDISNALYGDDHKLDAGIQGHVHCDGGGGHGAGCSLRDNKPTGHGCGVGIH